MIDDRIEWLMTKERFEVCMYASSYICSYYVISTYVQLFNFSVPGSHFNAYAVLTWLKGYFVLV